MFCLNNDNNFDLKVNVKRDNGRELLLESVSFEKYPTSVGAGGSSGRVA